MPAVRATWDFGKHDIHAGWQLLFEIGAHPAGLLMTPAKTIRARAGVPPARLRQP